MTIDSIVGLPSSDRVPGTYIEIDFNQGASTGGAGARDAVYCMPMLASGASWQANQLIQFKTEAELIAGAGAGSPLHRAGKKHLAANRLNKVFALPYLPSSGGSPVAADGYSTFVGTATAQGTVTVTFCRETFKIAVNVGDTATTIGTNVQNYLNAKTWLPATALNTAGKVVFTAKITGKSQGDGTIGVIRFRVSTDAAGITVTSTGAALGLGAGAHPGADGTTTEAVNLTAALLTIDAVRKYYIGVSVWDSASLALVKSHVSTKSAATPGLRSVFVAGYTGSLSSGQTLAIASNYERGQIVWQLNSEHDVADLVGQVMAIRQKYESADPVYNFDWYSDADWDISPVYATADRLDHSDLNDGIRAGLTPIQSTDTGSYLVTSSTTRTKNSAGLIDDFRSAESHRVSGADYISDAIGNNATARFQKFKLRDDVKNKDGSVDLSQQIGPKVLTPYNFGKFLKAQLVPFGPAPAGGEMLQSLSTAQSSVATQIDPNNSGRIQSSFDIAVINLVHQLSILVSETSSG
jgi:phage tail sheath gpL-like